MKIIGFYERHEWPASVLGVLGVIGLLIAFGVVVQEGVRQGKANRRADALLVEATWRCKTLKSDTQREECLQRYRQELPDSSLAVQALVSDVAAAAPRPALGQ